MADKEVYNPYEHRDHSSPLSNFAAFVTLMSCMVGVGVLALPLGFYFAGILNGMILLIVLTILLVHGMHLLIRSMVECSRRMEVGYATYCESVTYSFMQGPGCFRCWARYGGYLVDLVLVCSHYGMCVIYLVFVSVSFKYIIDQYTQPIDRRIYVAIFGFLSIPIFLIRKLVNLASANLLSSVMAYFGFLFMCYFLFLGLPPLNERRAIFGELGKCVLLLGIVLISISSVGVILAIEANMESPQGFTGCCGMLNVCVGVLLFAYTILGVFGYWRFGDKVAVSVSLNLSPKQAVALVSNLLIIFAVFLTYPLSGYVVIDIVMNNYWNKSGELEQAKGKETFLRIVFVLLTTLNGLMPLNLFPLLSLVGALTISLLNIIFPALIEICLYYPPEYRLGRPKWKLWKNIFLICLGTGILITGSYFSIKEMNETYGSSNVGPYNSTWEDTEI